MAKETIVWSQAEAAQVKHLIETGGGRVTMKEKISNFPPRWKLVYVDKKSE